VTPCRFAGGALRTFYHSDYFRSATRHADAPKLSGDEQALLDLYEEIANDRRSGSTWRSRPATYSSSRTTR